MEVRMIPNRLRPGVGLSPARENRRAFLPQHARMLPLVEEASRLGFLVYPPLHPHESLQLHARGNGVLTVTFFVGDENGWRRPAFTAEVVRSAGYGGLTHTAITILERDRGYDEASARTLIDAVTSGIHAPPGTVGLRGTHNFITPEGWDTIFTAVLNDVQRPAVGVISVCAETDWLPVETEFRYVLEKGDVVSMIGGGPIGQVLFVRREEHLLAEASAEEQERFARLQRKYAEDGARNTRLTVYGGAFTERYQEQQRARRAGGDPADLLRDPPAPP